MDKLERYLDQICRGIGGPRSLREHVRQELREHLLDAAAEHRAAGISQEQAIDRALDHFGGPEQVRAELEATHGHRLLPVVIDKAMQWKEKTMKAKWLWTTWAHLALAAVIFLEIAFVAASVIFIFPKWQEILQHATGDDSGFDSIMPRAKAWLGVLHVITSNGLVITILIVALWSAFEWRVRGENKSWIRLSVMGTIAVILMGAVVITAAAMTIPMAIAAPMFEEQAPERIVRAQTLRLEESISAVDRDVSARNSDALSYDLSEAEKAMDRLAHLGGAAPAIVSAPQQGKVDALRTDLRSAHQALRDAWQAALVSDPIRLNDAMRRFHEAYGPVRAATQPAP